MILWLGGWKRRGEGEISEMTGRPFRLILSDLLLIAHDADLTMLAASMSKSIRPSIHRSAIRFHRNHGSVVISWNPRCTSLLSDLDEFVTELPSAFNKFCRARLESTHRAPSCGVVSPCHHSSLSASRGSSSCIIHLVELSASVQIQHRAFYSYNAALNLSFNHLVFLLASKYPVHAVMTTIDHEWPNLRERATSSWPCSQFQIPWPSRRHDPLSWL